MDEILKRQLAKTGIMMKIPVFLFEDGIIERIDTDDQCTPLLQSSSLLESILHKAETEDMTYILSDSFEAIYGAVSGGDDNFLYDCLETLRKKEFLGFHKEKVDRLERELLAL